MAHKKRNSSRLDRTQEDAARTIIEKLLPQEDTRRQVAALLADSITRAHNCGSMTWGVTLFKDLIRLNAGPMAVFVLDKNGLYLVLDNTVLTERDRKQLRKHAQFDSERNYRSIPQAIGLRVPAQHLAAVLPGVQDAHGQLVEKAAGTQKRTTWYEAHSPGVLAYLRRYLGSEIPDPGYVEEILAAGKLQGEASQEISLQTTLARSLAAQSLHFTPWQIASFYTALQVKGFVILSGISGTGKTRLAQHFAELLPQPASGSTNMPDSAILLAVQPYMHKYGCIIIPRHAAHLFDPPQAGKTKDVLLTFDGQSQTCRLAHVAHADADYIQLHLRGAARQWFNKNLSSGDTLRLEPEPDADQDLINFRLYRDVKPREESNQPARTSAPPEKNSLFISVRPDWRDSKSLLGYYNPLTSRYEWTPFLRFLLRAEASYRAQDGLAWFVILDEMNLARVEYYFADLLSVLESGRNSQGFTREPLRLLYPEDAGGDLPPQELFLPPNLYFIGTVNTDETTHAFSPKVLDRAFTLQLTETDFANYPPPLDEQTASLSTGERQAIAKSFTCNSTFARIGKDVVAGYVSTHPAVRGQLQNLNELLRPHNLHFGYRVFDEIVSFLAAAEENRLFGSGTIEPDAAFDAAVLMKVLPKFHGSRGRLESPLRALLAWCANPEAPDQQIISHILDKSGADDDALSRLNETGYRYLHIAERACRMLRSLYVDGFAAFGD